MIGSLPKLILEGRTRIGSVRRQVVAHAQAGPPVEMQLKVPDFEQQDVYWCWAAVAQNLAAAYGENPRTQCEIARLVLGFECCPEQTIDCCNTPHELSPALEITGNLASHLSFDETIHDWEFIVKSIFNHSPIAVRIERALAGEKPNGHVVIITGYDTASLRLYVSDPDPDGPFFVYHSDVLSRYDGDGYWNYVYLTKGTYPPDEMT